MFKKCFFLLYLHLILKYILRKNNVNFPLSSSLIMFFCCTVRSLSLMYNLWTGQRRNLFFIERRLEYI